ncbi:MAG: hypothetical protein Q9175_001141 [Cornicularia normoerica]
MARHFPKRRRPSPLKPVLQLPFQPRISTEDTKSAQILKFAGIIDGKWSTLPTEEEALQGKLEPWLEFRQLYRKSDLQHFNDSESSKVKIAFNGLAEAVFRAADVLIATAGKTELPKNTTFQQIVMDKISVATHGELLCCWGGTETLTIIEDGKQLPATKLLGNPDLDSHPSHVGIASPYSGQQKETRKTLYKAGVMRIQEGTTEFWRGEEADLMIVDLVRVGNDYDDPGFVSEKEHLNVFLTRQRQLLFVRTRQTRKKRRSSQAGSR